MDAAHSRALEHLARSGALQGLDPLTRPWQRGAVASALDNAEHGALSGAAQALIRRLNATLADRVGDASWSLEPHMAVAAASDASRWPLRPAAQDGRLYPAAGLEASLELPHVVLVTRPFLDNRLKRDPWYHGRKDRAVAGRANPAYILGSWRYLDLFFGVLDRNWGPPEVEGLLVSPAPYATEHFAMRVGPPGLRLELLASQLDTVTPWVSAPAVDRWLISHRLVAQPSDALSFSLEESVLFAGQGLPWRYLNPLSLGLLSQYESPGDGNAMLGASVHWQPVPTVRVFGQLMIDDIQIDNNGTGDQEPAGYALTAGASGGWGGGLVSWTALYTRVTNLAYRTPRNEEQYTVNGMGLGRNFSDYDQLTLRSTLLVGPRLLLGGDVSLLRQGRGDLRQQYPPVTAYDDSLAFLTGTVERTVQLAVSADWTPWDDLSVSALAGLHLQRNTGGQDGARDRRLIWRLGLAWRPSWSGSVAFR